MHRDAEDHNRLRAWTSVRAFLTLCLVAATIAAAGWLSIDVVSMWPWYLTLAATCALTIFVALYRTMPTTTSACVFLTEATVMLLAGSLSNVELARSGVRFEGFLGYKLMALAVAIIAPFPMWVGILIIGACGAGPVILFRSLSPDLQASFPVQEPWMAIIHAIVALFILRHRIHISRLEQALTRVTAEKKASEDVAHVFLAMRDLTNTPLQSIEMITKLLRTETLERREASEHLERSMIRLRELSKAMARYEGDLNWANMTASFEAVVDLENKLSHLRSRAVPRLP